MFRKKIMSPLLEVLKLVDVAKTDGLRSTNIRVATCCRIGVLYVVVIVFTSLFQFLNISCISAM